MTPHTAERSAPAIAASTVIYVVDDEGAVRDSLAMLLRSIGLVPRCYANPLDFIREFDPSVRSCVVLDLRMPQMSGLSVQEWLSGHGHEVPVIFITGHGDVKMAVKAMRHGAVDFIEKPIHDQTLLDAIQAAIARDEATRARRKARDDLNERLDQLTPRERDVLDRLIEGISTKAIARDLDLSHRTVEGYRMRVLEKMRVGSLTELVNLYRRAG